MTEKARIAHLAGPNATIQNTPALVTSNKARQIHGLPLMTDADGVPERFDALRAQRLAKPVIVYVEQFSAHPLESDTAELYGPPDGYLDADGNFHKERQDKSDKPVYEIELTPEDGLYPLPYMAVQANGEAWKEVCASPGAPEEQARQGFYPDGSRSFEEIDRLAVDHNGHASMISSLATVDFFRGAAPGGYKKGLAAERRTDIGDGDHGMMFTQGSPQVEECAYWFNLLIDTTKPICGNAAQRPHGQISNDGPMNLVSSVQFVTSGVWADEAGRNKCGTVVIQEQQIFAAREVAKLDARPGGYGATGGHGGIIGQFTHRDELHLTYLPVFKHTYLSDVNMTKLPQSTTAVRRNGAGIELIEVAVKDDDGNLLGDAIPVVSIAKDGSFAGLEIGDDPALEEDLIASINHKLKLGRLAGFIMEGMVPYGVSTSAARMRALLGAVRSGLPVAKVGRGGAGGICRSAPLFHRGGQPDRDQGAAAPDGVPAEIRMSAAGAGSGCPRTRNWRRSARPRRNIRPSSTATSPDFSNPLMHRGGESRKMAIRQSLTAIPERPRCKQSVAQHCSNLNRLNGTRLWPGSMAESSHRMPEGCCWGGWIAASG